TWLIVAGPTMVWQVERHGIAAPQTAGMLAGLVAFLVFFLLRCRRECGRGQEIIFLALQGAAALVCVWLQFNGFVEVLLVIAAGPLGRYPVRLTAAVWVLEA